MRVHFGVMASLAVPLLITTSIIDRFCQGIIPHGTTHHSHSVPPSRNCLGFHPPSDPLALLQNDLDADTIVHDRQDNDTRTLLFRVVKCVAIPPNTQACVSVTTSSVVLGYMVPHSNPAQNRIFILASVIVDALPHVPTTILVTNLSKKPTTLRK